MSDLEPAAERSLDFFDVVRTLAERTRRAFVSFQQEIAGGEQSMIYSAPQRPFRPRYLIVEAGGFDIEDVKIGAMSQFVSYLPAPSSAFSPAGLDRMLADALETGEIPERFRFDGDTADVGSMLSILARNTESKSRIFRAVILGDLMETRSGWSGDIRGRLQAIGMTKKHTFVEIRVTGTGAFDGDTIRIPVSRTEMMSLGEDLGLEVRIVVQVADRYEPARPGEHDVGVPRKER